MPLAVYLELQTRPELAVLLSLLLLVLSATVFLLVRGVVPGGGRS
jgi:ABC-type sulfate transport system permease component